jgi:Uma2 family endonuclease
MSTALAARRPATVADLIASLGDVPLSRVRLDPPPGTATEADLLRLMACEDRLYELVDGTLVEKPMGWKEALLATWLSHQLQKYMETNDLGAVVGADGTLRLRKWLVRVPDVAFVLWEKVPPDDELPQIPDLAPDLAVEVISPSNTAREMARKRKEYFGAGTRFVWQVYPDRKEVEVYSLPGRSRTLGLTDTLDGGDLLPGFRLPLADLFAERGAGKRRGKRRRKAGGGR